MKPAALVVHQVRYEQKAYWRNPASAFLTFVFPLVFLVILASLNNGTTISFLGGLAYNQFYVPGTPSAAVSTVIRAATTTLFPSRPPISAQAGSGVARNHLSSPDWRRSDNEIASWV